MSTKLNELKLSPTKPDSLDLDRTIHDADTGVPALGSDKKKALAPIKSSNSPRSPRAPSSARRVTNLSLEEPVQSNAGEDERGPEDTIDIAINDTGLANDLNISEQGKDILEIDKEIEEAKEEAALAGEDMDEMYEVHPSNTKDFNQTRMSMNADEYIELSEERAREARVKQQLFSTSIRVMYVDRLNTTTLESQLHRAVYRGDEDEVRKLVLGRGLDLTAHPTYVDDIELGDMDIVDKLGRSALHIAAGGTCPGIVDILLLQSRIEFEKIRNQEMKRLKLERKECILELKKAFHEHLGIDRGDYRIQAVEKWFENEVSRLHRRVEFQSESAWLKLMTTRDNNGMTPLHHCVSVGSPQVLEAMLRPITGGRGEFTVRDANDSKSGKKTLHSMRTRALKQELVKNTKVPGYEWFDAGAIYTVASGQEVIALDQSPVESRTASLMGAPTMAATKYGTADSWDLEGFGGAQQAEDIVRASYTLMPGSSLAKSATHIQAPDVDYEIIVPWLVRNINKRSVEMGTRLGATGIEVLEELIDIVDSTGTRALVLPEINRFLGLLGIVVTRDVVRELCFMYPAPLEVVEEKWITTRGNQNDSSADSKNSDSKSFRSSGGKASSKGEKRGTRKSNRGDKNDDYQSESKGRERYDCEDDKGNSGDEDRIDILGEDEEFGLDFDKLLDDISTGRGMRSAVTSSTSFFGGTGQKREKTLGDDDVNCLDDIVELSEQKERSVMEPTYIMDLPQVVNISTIYKCRKCVVNARDQFGNTAVLLASAMSRRDHLNLLLSAGADISIVSNEGHSPIAVATDASIISSLQKELVTLIKKSKSSLIKNGFSTSTLENSGILGMSTRTAAGNTGKIDDMTSSLKNTQQLILQSRSDPESLLVHLEGLQKKRWGYSQGSLMWALESGTCEVIEKLLSAGANPNETDLMGRTVLHECLAMASRVSASDSAELELAASSIFTLRSIAESLIVAGADVNRKTSSGRTPLDELFCRGQDSDSTPTTPSRRTKGRASKAITKLSRTTGEQGHTKAIAKSLERLQSLLVRSLMQWGADALSLDRHGYNALFYCARENMPNCFIEMIKSGVDINFQCPRGRTALHTACMNGSADVASLICKWDADNKYGVQCIRDSAGKVPRDLVFGMDSLHLLTLWQACREGNSVRVNEILTKSHRRGTSTFENTAAIERGRNEDVVSADNDMGLSHKVLSETAGVGTSNQDLWLLDGVDAKTRRRKWTPLHACVVGWGEASAMDGNNISARRALEMSDASPISATRISARKISSDKNKPSMASPLRNRLVEKEGKQRQYSAVVSVLLQNYAFVDSMDYKCRTPLMFAAACNLTDCVSLLCTGGADMNIRDLDGNTPLHYANAYGSIAAAAVLEGKGADNTALNSNQLTPDDIIGQFKAVLPI